MILDLPRFLGNPMQHWVTNPEDYLVFLENNSGRWPCYQSHNAFTSPDAKTAIVRVIPFDLDCKRKPENALDDAQRIREWGDSNDVAVQVNVSGGKGYHVYLCFDPVKADNNAALKTTYQRLQDRVVEDAGCRHADTKIHGDTRRLMRVPNTMHTDTGKYCVELPDDLLDANDHEAITDHASRPRPLVASPTPRESLAGAVKRLDLTDSETDAQPEYGDFADYDGIAPEFVQALLPRPCVHDGLMERNPPHLIRLEALIEMVNARYSLGFLQRFFDDIADQAGWVDRTNAERRHYQVEHLWRKGSGHYSQYSCERIREEGHCIGSDCPFFADAFPREVEEE